jgi:hypothetical protein
MRISTKIMCPYCKLPQSIVIDFSLVDTLKKFTEKEPDRSNIFIDGEYHLCEELFCGQFIENFGCGKRFRIDSKLKVTTTVEKINHSPNLVSYNRRREHNVKSCPMCENTANISSKKNISNTP